MANLDDDFLLRLAPAIPGDSTCRRKSDLFALGPAFWPAGFCLPSLPKSICISKNHTSDAQGFNSDAFLATCWSSFSINFPARLNFLNCNRYNAKTSFLQFQASHFGSITQSNNQFVFNHPSRTQLFSFYLDFH